MALAGNRQGSHRSGRARISASGSSDRQIRHPRMVPEAIRSTYVDMLENLDVFNMFPSIESADRRFAFLHRVLQGEFPCFNGTIKALRLPAAHPAALRFLRLAVPRFHSLFSLPSGRVNRWGLELVTRCLQPGVRRGANRILPSSWGTTIVRLHMFQSDAGRTACTRPFTVQQRGPWLNKGKGSHERSFDAQ